MSAAVMPRHPFEVATSPPILVATDGRSESDAALLMAARVVDRIGGVPRVVDVLAPLPQFGELPMATDEPFEAERLATASEAVHRQLESVVGAAWPTEVRRGVPAEAIVEAAAEHEAELVVLGIGRHGMLDRLFGTETALHVLRGGRPPVLAVGPEADGEIRRAVVAMDFGPASVRAAAVACRLLAPGGTLSLVHVRSGYDVARDGWDTRRSRQVADSLRRLAAALRHGTTGCADCGASLGRDDVTIGTAVLVGDPAHEVLDYAERVGAELVAVGTTGKGLVGRLVVGSVAGEVVRGASARWAGCSVLGCGA